MRSIVELIAAKRDGGELSGDEIRRLIADYTGDAVPDYQMAALAMAIFYRGLNDREVKTWTDAMARSGRVLDFGEARGTVVDKHSTGGVGDKISLPLAPAVAACGVKVPMLAGRGLGHSGGTIDKLEAIPGYRAELTGEEITRLVAANGCVIAAQTEEIAPADKRLYALRDVTGTVESIPLVTASILSKKLAAGLSGLVLDVKVGRGAFMKDLGSARRLARSLISTGEGLGLRIIVFLTRMDEPLGRMVGNACEVEEAIATLEGRGGDEIETLVIELGGAMVELAHGVDAREGRHRVRDALADGSALAAWEQMVAAQGGDLGQLPRPTGETLIRAPRAGWVRSIDALEVGRVTTALGAGRLKQGDAIDPRVGVRIEAPGGTEVEEGQPVAAILHGERGGPADDVVARLTRAFEIGDFPPDPVPLIIERIG